MPDQRVCFIVGPIGEAGTPTRKLADFLLKVIIKPVLEQSDLKYAVKRADEDADPGSITSALISDLIEADLVIADLTGFNPNAFYELGIRHAIQKPTIHIIAQNALLPFDNRDQRTIFVDTTDVDDIESAKKRLRNAVMAIDADGYTVSNPVTHAKTTTALRESGDPRDNVIANLEDRLAQLEWKQAAQIADRAREANRYPNNFLQALNAGGSATELRWGDNSSSASSLFADAGLASGAYSIAPIIDRSAATAATASAETLGAAIARTAKEAKASSGDASEKKPRR